MVNATQDYFALLGSARCFRQDVQQLGKAWRRLASEVHPDRFATASEAEKRAALIIATQVNDAYQTLRSPLTRACYLLQLAGITLQEDTAGKVSTEFLMRQMDLRERIESARCQQDGAALMLIKQDIANEILAIEEDVARAFDEHNDPAKAAERVQAWRFLEKLAHEVNNAIETVRS